MISLESYKQIDRSGLAEKLADGAFVSELPEGVEKPDEVSYWPRVGTPAVHQVKALTTSRQDIQRVWEFDDVTAAVRLGGYTIIQFGDETEKYLLDVFVVGDLEDVDGGVQNLESVDALRNSSKATENPVTVEDLDIGGIKFFESRLTYLRNEYGQEGV